jgi:hypothetical protein
MLMPKVSSARVAARANAFLHDVPVEEMDFATTLVMGKEE